MKELRNLSGMTQKTFGEYFNIPIRTIENWESGKRTPPDYVIELMIYKLNNEGLIGGFTMKKYELIKTSKEFDFKERMEIEKGCSLFGEKEVLKSSLQKEEILNELSKYSSEITELSNNGTYYLVVEYSVLEIEVDEDDEIISEEDIFLETCNIKIEVCSKENYNTLETFDNMKDAVDFSNSCNDNTFINFK